MKTKLFPLLILTFLCGCNSYEPSLYIETDESDGTNKAIELAERILAIPSRSEAGPVNIEYILSSNTIRENKKPIRNDTLAYIVNYPDNGGFVIVSADWRIYPVLAYSHTGNFTLDGEDNFAKDQFISYLEPYMQKISLDANEYNIDDVILPTNTILNEEIKFGWNQGTPWNKYVIAEHPNCPAGCVAVALGQIMTHKKDSLYYHNEKFDFAAIRSGFETLRANPLEPGIINLVGGIGGGIIDTDDMITPAFSISFDRSAKLLYYIGKDVNMIYTPQGSSASSSSAYTLMRNLNYNLGEPSLFEYDSFAIAHKLNAKSLVYIDGVDYSRRKAHAWVLDGVSFSYREDPRHNPNDIYNIFFHCNWGWGGSNNGFFSAEVFSVMDRNYSGRYYFSVAR